MWVSRTLYYIIGLKRVCEEQSANFLVFDRNKLSSRLKAIQTATSKYREVEESGRSRTQQQAGQVRLPGVTRNTPAPAAVNNNGAAQAFSVNVIGEPFCDPPARPWPLIHPRQRGGQESWENMMYRAYYINSVTLKRKHSGRS